MKRIIKTAVPLLGLGLLAAAAGCGTDTPTRPNLPPFIRWSTPAPAGTLFVFPADTTTVEFTANDDGGTVTAVRIYVGGVLTKTLNKAPFRTVLDFSALGNNRSTRLYATAQDPEGAISATQDTLRFVKSIPDTGTWQQLSSCPCDARSEHSFSLDRQNRHAIVFGGNAPLAVPPFLNDAWIFDLASNSWSSLTLSGDAVEGRHRHAAGVSNGTLVIVGGLGTINDTLLDQGVLLDLATGVVTADVSLFRPKQVAGMGVAALDGDVYFYGGAIPDTGLPVPRATTDRLWIYDGQRSEWDEVTDLGVQPGARVYAAMTANREADELVLYGGQPQITDTDTLPEDASPYRLDVASSFWRKSVVTGPPPLSETALVYDSVNNRILMWGGRDPQRNLPTTIWEFSLGSFAWRQVPSTNSGPAGRYAHGMVAEEFAPDSAGGRLIIFGGRDAVGSYDDTWEWRW